MREYQVRICERLRVKFPGPTRQKRPFILSSFSSKLRGARPSRSASAAGERSRRMPSILMAHDVRDVRCNELPKNGHNAAGPGSSSLMTARESRDRWRPRGSACRPAHPTIISMYPLSRHAPYDANPRREGAIKNLKRTSPRYLT
jgi:hypothetical protein